MTPQETINRTIEGELASQHKTKTNLASRLQLSRKSIQNRLNGTTSWTLDDLNTTAEYLNMTIWRLLALAKQRYDAAPSAD